MLPIPVAKFEPEQWRSLEKQLIAVAAKEKRELEPRDRKVNNVLSLVQYSAKARQWQDVFKTLRDRGIIKLKQANPTLLQLLTVQKIALFLVSAPPRPKPKTKPTPKPPKAKREVTPRVRVKATPKQKAPKIRYSPTLFRFFLCFLFWLSLEAQNHRLTAMFFSLTYIHSGYPRLKSSAKIGANVRKVLIAFCTRNKRVRKAASTKKKALQLNAVFNQILTDKLQDSHSLYTKFCALVDDPMPRTQFDDRLKYRAKKGDIYYHNNAQNRMVFYALRETTEFESEWIALHDAYQYAVSKGCQSNFATFRKRAYRRDRTRASTINYFRTYGLDFRFEVPTEENQFLKWRVIN